MQSSLSLAFSLSLVVRPLGVVLIYWHRRQREVEVGQGRSTLLPQRRQRCFQLGCPCNQARFGQRVQRLALHSRRRRLAIARCCAVPLQAVLQRRTRCTPTPTITLF